MMNEGSPPALPEVIEALLEVKLTKEQVGESWLCLLRWSGNSFLSFFNSSLIICSDVLYRGGYRVPFSHCLNDPLIQLD